VFLSNRTYNEGAKQFVVLAEAEKQDLETVLAFDQFNESKTSSNIAAWLREGHTHGGIKADYILCHSTDGASCIECSRGKSGISGPHIRVETRP
jgi:hypothetical protein